MSWLSMANVVKLRVYICLFWASCGRWVAGGCKEVEALRRGRDASGSAAPAYHYAPIYSLLSL